MTYYVFEDSAREPKRIGEMRFRSPPKESLVKLARQKYLKEADTQTTFTVSTRKCPKFKESLKGERGRFTILSYEVNGMEGKGN